MHSILISAEIDLTTNPIGSINNEHYTLYRSKLAAELARSDDLIQLFDSAGIDSATRHEFIDRLTDKALETLDITERPNRWVNQVAEMPAAEKIAQSRSDVLPLPTRDELESKGQLYTQAQARTGRKSLTIIDHLKTVWMPWIEAGVLSRPDLQRDPSAYVALSKWCGKPGNNLKEALGYDIPKKSTLLDELTARMISEGVPSTSFRSLANRRQRFDRSS